MYLRLVVCTKTLTNPRENQRALLKVGVPGKLMCFSMLEVLSVLRIRPAPSQVLAWGLCSYWWGRFISVAFAQYFSQMQFLVRTVKLVFSLKLEK